MSTTESSAETAPETKPKSAPADSCGACHSDAPAKAPTPERPTAKGWSRVRVPTMDCASEESEIRRAVDGIDGIRALTFQLGQRTLALDAPGAAVELAVAAMRKAGFDPQPLPDSGASSTAAASQAEDDHDRAGYIADNGDGPQGVPMLPKRRKRTEKTPNEAAAREE